MPRCRLKEPIMRVTNRILGGLYLACSIHAYAVTIEDLAEKNNKLIELDQEIALAEKSRKLMELKNGLVAAETIALPKIAAPKPEESIQVLSVHGVPGNPIVDVQYGDLFLQKKIGESLPDGWEITAVARATVTFTRKITGKNDMTRTVGIGHNSVPRTQIDAGARLVPAIPSRTTMDK